MRDQIDEGPGWFPLSILCNNKINLFFFSSMHKLPYRSIQYSLIIYSSTFMVSKICDAYIDYDTFWHIITG